MRLIDADSVLDALGVFTDTKNGNEHFLRGIDSAREIVDSCEVVAVVRCKYCEHWQDNNGGYPHEECRWGHDETPDADDFCSYGVRKGEHIRHETLEKRNVVCRCSAKIHRETI